MKRHASDEFDGLSVEERKLYDRQIRLWGLDAQKRLNKFRVCIAGMTSLGAEVAKNVILTGVAHVALMDSENVTGKDINSQFMIRQADLGKNRATASLPYAKRLNPMVEVVAKHGDICDEDVKALNVDIIVVCSLMPLTQIIELSKKCRRASLKLLVGHVTNGFGFFMSDLLEFRYVTETVSYGKTGKRTKHEESVKNFPPLEQILNETSTMTKSTRKLSKQLALQFRSIIEFYRHNFDEKMTAAAVNNYVPAISSKLGIDAKFLPAEKLEEVFAQEIIPVSAVVGGVLGQEVIKVASQNSEPIHNVFLFDAPTCTATSEFFHC